MALSNLLKTEIGSKEQGFILKIDVEGVFLTVFKNEDASGMPAFELTDITKALFEHDITEYNMETIVTTMREASGEPVRIASFLDDTGDGDGELKEPKLKLNVSKDKMTATIVAEGGRGYKMVTYNAIADLLNQSGIIFGVLEENIKKAVAEARRMGSTETVVAEGVRPENGTDAKLIDKFNVDDKGKPRFLDNGRVDFKNLNMFIVVNKGDLLQERIPHTMGTSGRNIYGDTVAAKPGKMKMISAGKNVKIVDEHKLVSMIDGQMIKDRNRISVVPVIEIRGDVGLSTGNIEFNGSVHVRGNISEGFYVRASGDVEIDGTVCGGSVDGSDVVIKAGIQGMQRSEINAKRDLKSKFAENAVISAGRTIEIQDAVLHSKVNAGKSVIVNGNRGMVIGGEIVAGELLDLKNVGNNAHTVTTLEVGVNPLLRKKISDKKKEQKQAEKSLDDALKALKILKAVPREQLPLNRQEMLVRLLRSQFTLEAKIKEIKDEIEDLKSEEEALKNAKVRVSDTAYPGVRVLICSLVRSIDSEVQHTTFYEDDGDVKIGPY